VYARRVGDKVLTFGHRGWLYEDSSFIFYDHQTDSLWVQATGEAIHGVYKGTKLERLPATHTTWKAWRTLHPETRVLARPDSQNERYWHDNYESYYLTGRSGIKQHHDGPLSFGLAVVLPKEQKLFPFAELAKKPVVTDRVAGEPVLIVFHAASRTAVAFDPRYKKQLLDFDLSRLEDTDVLLVDKGTRSTWSGLTGKCLSGPCQGGQLKQLPGTQFVVENWHLFYPKAARYKAPQEPVPRSQP